MRLEGSHTIAAPRDKVWRMLHDPEVLARCAPGVKSLAADGENRYRATLELGIGPVRGTFQGHLAITEQQEPEAMTLSVEGSGGPGGVKGQGRLRLVEEGHQTVVHYEGEPRLSGRLAGVGSRLVGGVAKKLAGQFFDNLEREAKSSPL
jgi:uncharacterized protein